MGLSILFVTPYVPSTVRVRPFAFIRELAKLGHKVTLVCLVQPDWESKYLSEVTPFCDAVYPVHLKRFEPYMHTLSSVFTPVPLSVAYCDSSEQKRLVNELLGKKSYDLIHTEFIRAAPVTMNLKDIPKVFDSVDSITLAYRRSLNAAHIPLNKRLISFYEWIKMRQYEPMMINFYDRVIVSSPVDQNILQQSYSRVEVIPNGVDLDYFSFHEGARDNSTIVFLGKMSYYVNVASILWFYKEIYPLVRRQVPDVCLKIVGRNPVPVITSLRKDSSVEVTGTVPDVRPYLRAATISICPMVSGAGSQFKMLEAMAIGTPCVSTSLSCQALDVKNGREMMIADTPQAFASAVCDLLADPGCRRQMARLGRDYVESCHDWQAIGQRLENVYQKASTERQN